MELSYKQIKLVTLFYTLLLETILYKGLTPCIAKFSNLILKIRILE